MLKERLESKISFLGSLAPNSEFTERPRSQEVEGSRVEVPEGVDSPLSTLGVPSVPPSVCTIAPPTLTQSHSPHTASKYE